MFTIYAITKYSLGTNRFIENNYEQYKLKDLTKILNNENKGYHERIKKDGQYKIFGDLDNYDKPINEFINIYCKFMKDNYDLEISVNDVMYTENKHKKGSYHYSVPKYNCSCDNLKKIHTELKKIVPQIDTTIYSDHWFRLPNQSKEGKIKTKHKIIVGEMKDFICAYIDPSSTNINNHKSLSYIQKKVTETKKEIINNIDDVDDIKKQDETKKITRADFNMLKDIYDNCLHKKRYNEYLYWVNVGMALKFTYDDSGFDSWIYFSSKAKNPDPKDKLKLKWNSFNKNNNQNPITIATIYHYAKEDNKDEYIKIMRKYNKFNLDGLTATDVSKYIKYLMPNNFFWQIRTNPKSEVLYCYNGRYWEETDAPLKRYISNELYEFLKDYIVTCYFDETDNKLFEKMRRSINRLKTNNFMEEIVKVSKLYLINNEIEFDSQFNLFGFEDKVYDLNNGEFRDYKFDDYITITTGYKWKEPKQDEIDELNMLFKQIQPNEDDRNLMLEILATSLEGRCLEKFIIFNGKGGNGKGVTDDLMLCAMGRYGLAGSKALLFEKTRTGSNPELNNLHKKRFILFRELPEYIPFENSIVKELTGGGKFSARGHQESTTEKVLHGTIIVECNDKPNFAEKPKDAEIRRLIDLYFPCKYTEDKDLLNEPFTYLANKKYKDETFKSQHKYALIKILMEHHKNYRNRNYEFNVPDSVKNRTLEYLGMSNDILVWMNNNYDVTENKTDIIKLKNAFDDFKESEYYYNLSKADKRKYNKKYFIEQFSNGPFFKKYYHEISSCKNYYNYITNHVKKPEEEKPNDRNFFKN